MKSDLAAVRRLYSDESGEQFAVTLDWQSKTGPCLWITSEGDKLSMPAREIEWLRDALNTVYYATDASTRLNPPKEQA